MRKALPLFAILAAACNSADAANWGGTMTDSAGVMIVSNPADGNWTVRPAMTVTQDLDIGQVEGDPEYMFGQVVALDVNERGDVFVLDQQASQVRTYDATGKHLRTIGKRGGGPGEFSQMTMFLRVGAGDTVFVADLMGQRLAKVGPDGVETGSYPFAFTGGVPMRFQPAPQGRFAVQLRKMALPGMVDSTPAPDRVIVRDVSGEHADTVLELESGKTVEFGGGGMKIRMFESEPLWALLDDGRMVRARNDVYRLEVLRADGTLERIVTKPTTAKPVTEADRTAILGMLEEGWKQAGGAQMNAQVLAMLKQSVSFADNYPVMGAITAGPDHTIWVQRVRSASDLQLAEGQAFQPEDINSPEWDVYDDQGRLLGMVSLPDRFIPLRVAGNAIYGRMADELDVQHVVRITVK